MCAHIPRATAAQSAALHRGALQRRVVLARVLHTKLVQCAAKHGLTRRQCRKVVSRYDALNMLHVRVLFQKNLNYLHSSPSTPPPMLQPPPRPSQASHGASGGHRPRPAPGGTISSSRRTTSTKSSVAALTHQNVHAPWCDGRVLLLRRVCVHWERWPPRGAGQLQCHSWEESGYAPAL